jgi:putative (di)nucleoside polyphosphate hydrolase
MTPTDLDHYRPNVGIVLFRPDGMVWLGRRARTPGPHNWQFPQGGVDEGEELDAAARRELAEETGVTSVSPLARIEDWIAYDFPPEHKGAKVARGWKGQKQVWFAYRFEGDDSEVDLDAHRNANGDVEFDAWRWAELADAVDLVVPFKRGAYRRVVDAFAAFAAGNHASHGFKQV